MGYQQVISSLGFGDLAAPDFLLAQIVIAVLSVILFVAALAVCAQAFRAVGAARRLRDKVDVEFRSMQDLAVEMRHLTAQVEQAAIRQASVLAVEPEAPEAAEAEITQDAAEAEYAADESSDGGEAAAEAQEADVEAEAPADQALDAAKRAASEPASLLRSFLRRKK